MTPIKVTFTSGQFITIWSKDPDAFIASVTEVSPPEIRLFECLEDDIECPELQEVRLTLRSGSMILGMIPKDEFAKAKILDEITACDESNTLAYAEMVTEENALDERLLAIKNISNNVPCLKTREYLHREYLKRKRAYIASLEAIIDGVIRRPQ